GVAKIALVADSRWPGIFNDWDNGGTGAGTPYPLNSLARVALANNNQPRHDGSNFLYADGHAKFLPTAAIVCPQDRGEAGEKPIVNPNAVELP
ncbi:MAG TPA: H-X9-DG-CTERM domain-containing protein, partial [Armatimonadota bacterium]|nr:H-X9-DG-CTERM domain-containing protein [Armatimonadota bacterium]